MMPPQEYAPVIPIYPRVRFPWSYVVAFSAAIAVNVYIAITLGSDVCWFAAGYVTATLVSLLTYRKIRP